MFIKFWCHGCNLASSKCFQNTIQFFLGSMCMGLWTTCDRKKYLTFSVVWRIVTEWLSDWATTRTSSHELLIICKVFWLRAGALWIWISISTKLFWPQLGCNDQCKAALTEDAFSVHPGAPPRYSSISSTLRRKALPQSEPYDAENWYNLNLNLFFTFNFDVAKLIRIMIKRVKNLELKWFQIVVHFNRYG